MTKDQFLNFVAATIKDNPDWLGDMIKATQQGVLKRLEEEQKKKADAESIVAMMYSKVYLDDDSMVEVLKERAKSVLRESIYKGTQFANNL